MRPSSAALSPSRLAPPSAHRSANPTPRLPQDAAAGTCTVWFDDEILQDDLVVGKVRAKRADECEKEEEDDDAGEIGKEALSTSALEALQLHLVEKETAADGR